jgi:integrase
MKPLTALSIERLKPAAARREIPDGLLPGLYHVIQPTGGRSWAVRYRAHGKPRKLTLGSYPTLGLAEARTAAREALRAVAEGQDPAGEKKAARVARDAAEDDSVAAHLDLFIQRYVKRKLKPRTQHEMERALRYDLLPFLGHRPVASVTRKDIVELIDRIVDRGSHVRANTVLAYCKRFFGWLCERSVLEHSPCDRVRQPTPIVSRDRVLSDDELRWLWNATERAGWPFGPLARLLLLTGQRRDEVTSMTWAEVRGDLWSIPKTRTKNHNPHDVPLSASAQAVLSALPRTNGRYVFTTNGRNAVSGFSDARNRLHRLMVEEARKEAVERGEDPETVTIPDWRFHDLRRTMATTMARLGVALEVVEKCLNHTSGSFAGVVGIYQRHSYGDEKRAAFERWAAFLHDLVERPAGAAVVPLRA